MQQYTDEVLAIINKTAKVIPAQRAAARAGYSFSTETFERQLEIWDHIWKHNPNFRARLHAYLFLERWVSRKEYHPVIWATSADWQEQIDDWGLCDALAKINTKVLETMPEQVYSRLSDWNKEANPWYRRQSVVSLLYYSRTKKEYLPFESIIALIKPLLADPEYYVQKGVGWALRELNSVYPAQTHPFLETHIRDLSPLAFTIAIEKMESGVKDKLKAMRKGRKKLKSREK